MRDIHALKKGTQNLDQCRYNFIRVRQKGKKRNFLSLLTVVCDTDRICSNNAQPISIKKDVNTTKKDLMEIEPL